MNTPECLKPAFLGAAGGALALAIVGFSWGGWTTDSTAQKMATERSTNDVVAVLTGICLDQASRDPQLVARTEAMKAVTPYKRGDLVADNGWATFSGGTEPNKVVARACASQLKI